MFITYIPIISGVVTAELYLLFSFEQSNANWVAAISIAIVLLGGVVGIWMQLVRFKKMAKGTEAKSARGVNSNADRISTDISDLKPVLFAIDENVKKIRDEVVEKIVPSISKLNGVDILVEDYEIEKALKENNSPNVYDQDILKGSIDLVYEENAKLHVELHENLKQQLHLYKLENDRLKAKVSNLEEYLSLCVENEPDRKGSPYIYPQNLIN